MGTLFRSENMELVQMILNSEASYLCIAELGELGILQFRDLNTSVNSFEKKFVRDVRRCEEMERQIRFVNGELNKCNINTWDATSSDGNMPDAPIPKDMANLEETLHSIEAELKEVNANHEKLRENFLELAEVKHVLRKTQVFFDEMNSHRSGGFDHSTSIENQAVGDYSLSSSAKLNFTAGVIPRNKVNVFEQILWRACRGNVFLKLTEIQDDQLRDSNGEVLEKNVFIVFYQGQTLESKVKKIAEGTRATIYPISEDSNERRDIQMQVMSKLEDVNAVVLQTEQHKTRLLSSCARNIKAWHTKVLKAKAIYHIHNMLQAGQGNQLIGEAWCPTSELDAVRAAMRTGTVKSGSTIPNIMEVMRHKKTPPTYNKTNKFTIGYQNLIDSYGICSYQEANPTPFTIISFPFLFGVMFGDMGHGIIMFLFAAWMIRKEEQLKKSGFGEIFDMIFGGRYIIILMAVFSTYCGFIYNDIFSKSLNFFGTSWKYECDYRAGQGDEGKIEYMCPETGVQLSPQNNFTHAYFYGSDPIWQLASNKIVWSNSFKMKSAVVMGIMQMLFGLLISFKNHTYFRNRLNIIGVFIPEMIFLCSIFVYLVFTIIFKWLFWGAEDSDCAPSLLINLINIFMFVTPEKCVGTSFKGTPTYIFPGQGFIQKILIFAALIAIPWMLLVKPYVLYKRHQKKLARTTGNFGGVNVTLDVSGDDRAPIIGSDEDDYDDVEQANYIEQDSVEEFDFQEIAIHQIIHTIEFCLSCISHTASYLRLWALSLAHAQLSDVLWNMMLGISLKMGGSMGIFAKYIVFFAFGTLTVGILIVMEGLSAFLHALRLHWVEFNSKFFKGEGYAFMPFSFVLLMEQPENLL
jgi:V-type H+-transporting ATPase subunit a